MVLYCHYDHDHKYSTLTPHGTYTIMPCTLRALLDTVVRYQEHLFHTPTPSPCPGLRYIRDAPDISRYSFGLYSE